MRLIDISELSRVFADAVRIPPKLSAAEWAETNIILSSDSGTARPGPIRLSKPQRGILEAYSDPNNEKIAIVGGAQVAKTTTSLCMMLYSIANEPNRMMVVTQDEKAAEDISIKRLTPLIRDCPTITGLFSPAKSRDSGNTIYDKSFKGGSVSFVTQGSPSQLRGKSIKYLFLEELSNWGHSSGAEGNPVSLAEQRTNTHKRRKIVANSTPGIKGVCQIEKLWLQSDKREFMVPCHACGTEQVLDWRNADGSYRVKWDLDAAGRPLYHTATYECPHCQARWSDAQRLKNIAKGEWRATAPQGQWIGFRLPTLVSDLTSLERLAAEWDGINGDRFKLQSFINNKLAEWWDESGEKPKLDKLKDRLEEYTPSTLPNDVCFATVGFDTQGDRFEYEVVGWGRLLESWSVDYGVVPYDATDPRAWEFITKLLDARYTRENGTTLRMSACCFDVGGNYTKDVLDKISKLSKPSRKIFAIMGSNKFDAPIWPKLSSQSKLAKKTFYYVGVSQAKNQVYNALNVQPEIDKMNHIQSGKQWLCHFPSHYEPHYFEMLTAEEKRITIDKRTNRTKVEWHKPSGMRNEALDCRVYALAAVYALGYNNPEQIERIYRGLNEKPIEKPQQLPPPPRLNTTGNSFGMNRFNGGFNNGSFGNRWG